MGWRRLAGRMDERGGARGVDGRDGGGDRGGLRGVLPDVGAGARGRDREADEAVKRARRGGEVSEQRIGEREAEARVREVRGRP